MKTKLITLLLVCLLIFSCTACSPSSFGGGEGFIGNAYQEEVKTETIDVTIVKNNGEANEVQKIVKGKRATIPTTPTKADRTFKGWYCNGVIFNWKTPITEPLTIQALWDEVSAPRYTFTIAYNNGQQDSVNVVDKGQLIAEPSTPINGNKTFLGWYCKGQPFSWSTPITEDTLVQALWQGSYTGNLKIANGSTSTVSGGWKNTGSTLIMANTTDGFDRGTISVDMTSPSASDSGIIFCLSTNGMSSYWEQGVSYYFFFVSQGGTAYLGKVNNGKWSALSSVAISGYAVGTKYNIKVVLNGTTISCYVNNKLYVNYSEEVGFLTGTGYGLRTAVSGVTFTNFVVNTNV